MKKMQMRVPGFRRLIRGYYREHKRSMPWRRTHDPYQILVSEVMLQQTQASRVMKFYPDFIKKFPNFRVLARAETSEVLRAWQGLGYNRRALNLQKLSRVVLEIFNGKLPRERTELVKLPGVGEGTAGALRAFIWNEPEVFIETNIRRAFIHFFFPRRMRVTDAALKRYIERTLDRSNPREWYWALMDYGAMLGRTAKADENPNRRSAQYVRQPRFAGSDRELRGKLLKILLERKRISLEKAAQEFGESRARMKRVARNLAREGFLKRENAGTVMLLT